MVKRRDRNSMAPFHNKKIHGSYSARRYDFVKRIVCCFICYDIGRQQWLHFIFVGLRCSHQFIDSRTNLRQAMIKLEQPILHLDYLGSCNTFDATSGRWSKVRCVEVDIEIHATLSSPSTEWHSDTCTVLE